MNETLLMKNNSIELQIFTVHKIKLNKHSTTSHTNWNGTLGHTSSTAPPLPKHDETLIRAIAIKL